MSKRLRNGNCRCNSAGAGIFGLTIAWECVQRGASVRVVDPFGIGAGASGGIVGALAPHTPERWNAKKEFQFHCLINAKAFWDKVEAASGLSTGYGRTGRLQPIINENMLEFAHIRTEVAKTLWKGQADWRVIPAKGAWAPQSPTGYLVHDTLSARLHPRRACNALAAALAANGCAVVSEAADEGAVIWATGLAGLTDLGQDMGTTVGNGVKGQAALLAYDARDAPQLFADGVHIIPHGDGTTAIGSTSERYYDNPTATDGQLDDILARAISAFPVLSGAEVIARWAGVRPRAGSRAPMLGAWPGRGGHYVANGGFKIGFAMAPGVARLMADLVLEGVDDISPDFSINASLPA